MIVRQYNPETDTPEMLAQLSDFTPEWKEWMAKNYANFPPRDVIVAEVDGKLVGVLHIFDNGFPWVFLDHWYLQPAYRSHANARKLGQFAEKMLLERGVRLITTTAPKRIGKALKRHGYQSNNIELTHWIKGI